MALLIRSKSIYELTKFSQHGLSLFLLLSRSMTIMIFLSPILHVDLRPAGVVWLASIGVSDLLLIGWRCPCGPACMPWLHSISNR